MIRRPSLALALAVALAAVQGGTASAQWGYPGGYGGYGWGGWGGGGETVQGSIARGLGFYAAGAGVYNQKTAVANSINADTVMRWNQYMYESQKEANRNERLRIERRKATNIQAYNEIYNRLRNNPSPNDIYRGDALNVLLEEINDPRIYSRTLESAKVKLGGELIRDIPFQYAAGAITTSFHQIAAGEPPAVLKTPPFAPVRAELKAVGAEIRKQIQDDGSPKSETINQALALVNKAEAQVSSTLARNSRDRVAAERYLKSLHGLLGMLNTPAIDVLLSGVEKRPDANLGDLLTFMNAYSLRFGAATTPRQRTVYDDLYPKLVALSAKVAPALATAPPARVNGNEADEFFSGMQVEDLQKKAPAPPAPGTTTK